MNSEEFRTLAEKIAGPRWKSRIGPMIGRRREAVWAYATNDRGVPEPVAKLLRLMAEREVG